MQGNALTLPLVCRLSTRCPCSRRVVQPAAGLPLPGALLPNLEPPVYPDLNCLNMLQQPCTAARVWPAAALHAADPSLTR